MANDKHHYESLHAAIESQTSKNEWYSRAVTILAINVAIATFAVGSWALLSDGASGLFGAEAKQQDQSSVQIENVEKRMNAIERRIGALEKSLSAPSTDVTIKALGARVDALEQNHKDLSSTILHDADKALTSRLLREQQLNIQKEINTVKQTNASLSDKVDNFVATIFAIPIVGFILTLVSAAVLFVWHKLKLTSAGKDK